MSTCRKVMHAINMVQEQVVQAHKHRKASCGPWLQLSPGKVKGDAESILGAWSGFPGHDKEA